MMKRLQIVAPAGLFSVLFLVLALLSSAGLPPLPLWARTVIGLLWIGSLFQYVITLEMQKQIGGWISIALFTVILCAMLSPFHVISRTPQAVSESADVGFRTAWEAVYTGELFENFSPKKTIRSYLAMIGHLDPFRLGRILAFTLLSFFLAVCFLYPSTFHDGKNYRHRLYVVIVGLVLLSVQTELAQVLSPTRKVSVVGVLFSLTGVAFGLAMMVGLQYLQLHYSRRHPKSSRRFNVLGVAIDAIRMQDCLDVFEEAIAAEIPRSRPALVAPMGVAGIVQARRDPRFQHILNNTNINTPDGMPLVWLGKLHGYRNIERVYGPDMMYRACAEGVTKGWTHYFYGAAPGVATKLKTTFENLFPGIRILGAESPPFHPLDTKEEKDLTERINDLNPDFFWIGISTPKQLYLMNRLATRLSCKVICPVGYAFDVHAGIQEDAPEWIKLAGFQWLHRLIKQPRLWRRYLPDNPRFIVEVVMQLLHLRKYPMVSHESSENTNPVSESTL